MNYDNIKKLLERFYAGETSLEEESLLRDFFRQDEIPEELKADQVQFMMYEASESMEVLGASFDETLFSKIEEESKNTRNIQRWLYSISGVAAAALIAMLLWTGGLFNADKPLPGTINNPQMAFAETQKALLLISSNLNQGLKPVQTVSTDLYGPMQQVSGINKLSQSIRKAGELDAFERAFQLIRPVGSMPY